MILHGALDLGIADESKRKQPPCRRDIRQTERILKDFGIFIPLPDFSCEADMLRWRSDLVHQKMEVRY